MADAVTPGWRFWIGGSIAVARRPDLWRTGIRQVRVLARPQWWKRAPFVPVPDSGYLRFRWETQYGASGTPDPDDLVTYLEWCRESGR
jgi:hypothetical protein